jgi:hypothetical protein
LAVAPASPLDLAPAGALAPVAALDLKPVAVLDLAPAGAASSGSARRRTRPPERSFSAFLRSFPPDAPPHPMNGTLSPLRRQHVHPLLLRFWSEVGLGSFGNGCLHFFDPTNYECLLARLLVQEKVYPTRVPFARSAAGDLFYWRDLRSQSADTGAPETWDLAGDVSAVSIHSCTVHRISLTPRAFFATDLAAHLHGGR